ncbi:Glutamyl-tRNA(Gln) amidotransferase subunit D [Candidatus Anstonella stagnisolia]|nr:Glutamyl-tRNA(Gln) amidotransferase subunit D [Candidatus Anstonella stagnisolia]
MYSKDAQKLLKGAKVGDELRLHTSEKEYSGILMPHPDNGDENCVVLKLSSGYNVGIDAGKISRVDVLQKGKGIVVGSAAKKNAGGSTGKTSDAGKSAGSVFQSGEGKEFVSLLGCGGTIASKVEYKTGAVYPASKPEEIMESFPNISKISNIRSRVLFQLLSEDMAPRHWSAIAGEVADEIKSGPQGVVLMHGTDTMGYTSAALSFMLQELPMPVVLTGSQRSSDRPSSDADVNVTGAMLAAKSDIAQVMVCMHKGMSDDVCSLHSGVRVRKFHTSRRDAFASVNAKPVGEADVVKGEVRAFGEHRKRDMKRKLKLFEKVNENVALVWVYPGMDEKFVKKLGDFDGVVLACTGIGHAPVNAFGTKDANSILPALEKIMDAGTLVALAPQTIFGRINMDIYTTGRLLKKAGVIGDLCDWLPETAYAKMCWALGQERKKEKAAGLMMRNIAGEISERSAMDERVEFG